MDSFDREVMQGWESCATCCFWSGIRSIEFVTIRFCCNDKAKCMNRKSPTYNAPKDPMSSCCEHKPLT